jgi:hypothetical protein
MESATPQVSLAPLLGGHVKIKTSEPDVVQTPEAPEMECSFSASLQVDLVYIAKDAVAPEQSALAKTGAGGFPICDVIS